MSSLAVQSSTAVQPKVLTARLPRGFSYYLKIEHRRDGMYFVTNRGRSYAFIWLAAGLTFVGLGVYFVLTDRPLNRLAAEWANDGLIRFIVTMFGSFSLPFLVHALILASAYESIVLDLYGKMVTFTRRRIHGTRTSTFALARAVVAPCVICNVADMTRTLSGWVLLNEDDPDELIVLASDGDPSKVSEYAAGLPKEWRHIRRLDQPYIVVVRVPMGAKMPR